MADTNRERMEAALRQEWGVSIQTFTPGARTIPDLATRLLEALGVDPVGTTEPQGDVEEPCTMNPEAVELLAKSRRIGFLQTPKQTAVLVHRLAHTCYEALAEVERLRAQIEECNGAWADATGSLQQLRADLASLLGLLALPPGAGLAAAVDRARALLAENALMRKTRLGGPLSARYTLTEKGEAAVRGEATDTEEAPHG